ncbi:MAG: hypothetical protein KJ060_03710 [Candidatus Hydrogenedentes bacterium]|nr:hypothetical protein [Candidatus Hydrogenedentota bacterium]
MTAEALTRDERRARLYGCLFWAVASLIIVFVRGVRWDETYEHALAITRLAPYPEGHPFFIYCRNVFSLQSYLSAGLLWLTRSALVVCFIRDLALMLFVTLPLFLLTFALTRRALWGHVAVVLALCGVYSFFGSHYGIGTWTGFFSVGGIGAGYALLTFTAFVAGWTRTAWFLLTFLFAVHAGQLPPLLLFAGAQLVIGDWERRKAQWRAAFFWGGAGFVGSVLFYVIQRFFIVPLPDSGPYYADANVHEIWINYSMREDVHRFISFAHPFSHSVLLIGLTLAVSLTVLLAAKPNESRKSPAAAIALYALCVGVLAVGIRLIHHFMGENVPFLLVVWMPYRVPNHLAPILLALCLALLAHDTRNAGPRDRAPLWAALLCVFALPIALSGRFLPETLYVRYLEEGEYLFFILIGGALGAIAERAYGYSTKTFVVWCVASVVALVALTTFNQFIVACTVAGFALHWTLRVLPKSIDRANMIRNGAFACAGFVLVLLLAREWGTREHLPRTRFQEGVVRYLADAGEPDAMIVPPYWDVEWNARTGAPVFLDYQTPRLITYMPSLGPSLRKMIRDTYGFSIDGTSNAGLAHWSMLSREEWKAMAEAYGIRYFVQAANEPCNFTPVYSEDGLSLYEVPSDE